MEAKDSERIETPHDQSELIRLEKKNRFIPAFVVVLLFGAIFFYKQNIIQKEKMFRKKEAKLLSEVVNSNMAGSMNKGSGRKGLLEVPRLRKTTFDRTNMLLPVEKIQSGGVRKDGIPALTGPKMISAEKANFLKDNAEVAGVSLDGDAHAFPIQILNYHEAINTKIGNQSVLVTFCPLCKSLVVFDRVIDGEELTFKISGRLYNSNVLLYSEGGKKNDPLYSQMMVKQISGERSGEIVKTIPVELTTWKSWKERYPQTKVLSENTGHSRDYSSDPYKRYLKSEKLYFPVETRSDRLPLKSFVLGLWSGEKYCAYPLEEFEKLNKSREIDITLNTKKATIFYDHEAKSLRLLKSDESINWMYSFWFAWYAFHPETEIFTLAD